MDTATSRSTARPVAGAFSALLACAALAGCGSDKVGVQTTGAGARITSIGTITGFGSVHVNGHRFDTRKAAIVVNGQSATQADLRVGEVVTVQGHHDSASDTDVADQIDFRADVQGPIASIDAASHSLVVLGQTIVVSSATSFDSAISPADLSGLKVGDSIEVSGMPATNGDIQAMRIERASAGSALEVVGHVSMTDTSAKTFHINALTVDYSAATLLGFASGAPHDGDPVEARGSALSAAGALQASQVESLTGEEHAGEHDGHEDLEGLITRFVSATDFDVDGHAVTTDAATVFEGGTAADLALNVRVEVEGEPNAGGVLLARKVSFEHEAAVALIAQVDAVDTTAQTVTLLGVAIAVTANTRFDSGDDSDQTFALADVHAGDWLAVRAGPASGGSGLEALRLERRAAQTRVTIWGAVTAAAQPSFSILAFSVTTTTQTQLFDALGAAATPDAFFTQLVGQPVFAHGSWDGKLLTAQDASLARDGHD